MPCARASSLDRLLACAGGAILGGQDEKSDRAREAADWGTLVHHWKATGEIKQVGQWKNHPALFKRKLEKSGVKREDYWPDDMSHEFAYAFNVLTGKVNASTWTLPAKYQNDLEQWKASHDDRYVTGTCDGYAFLFDSVLWVDDLKTGRFASLEEYNCQLLFYALCVSRSLDYRADVNVTLTHWTRYPNHGLPERIGRVVTQDELKDFEGRLLVLRDEILRGREGLKLVSGEQCTWCPSRGICPEYQRGMN